MSKTSENSKRKYFAPADVFAVAVILLAAALGFMGAFAFSGADNLVAVVSVNGQVYSEIDLSEVAEPYEMTVAGEGEAVLHISSEGVRFVISDCPDKLCVNTGLLTRSGQSAVCLPARVSVKLVSGDSSGQPDAIVG